MRCHAPLMKDGFLLCSGKYIATFVGMYRMVVDVYMPLSTVTRHKGPDASYCSSGGVLLRVRTQHLELGDLHGVGND